MYMSRGVHHLANVAFIKKCGVEGNGGKCGEREREIPWYSNKNGILVHKFLKVVYSSVANFG